MQHGLGDIPITKALGRAKEKNGLAWPRKLWGITKSSKSRIILVEKSLRRSMELAFASRKGIVRIVFSALPEFLRQITRGSRDVILPGLPQLSDAFKQLAKAGKPLSRLRWIISSS